MGAADRGEVLRGLIPVGGGVSALQHHCRHEVGHPTAFCKCCSYLSASPQSLGSWPEIWGLSKMEGFLGTGMGPQGGPGPVSELHAPRDSQTSLRWGGLYLFYKKETEALRG